MDTAELVIEDKQIADFIVQRISKEIGFRHHSRKSKKQTKALKWGYNRGAAFTIFDKTVFIAWDPKERKKSEGEPPKRPLPPLLVNFHFSQFDTIQDFFRWALIAFGKSGLPDILSGRLTRLDTAIYSECDIDTVEREVVQSRARSSREVESKTKTVYWGKPPRRTRAYEDEVPRFKLDHSLQDGDPGEVVSATKMEVEHKGRRVPIWCLRELDKLRNINPFHHLRYLNNEELVIPPGTPRKIEEKIWAYKYRCEKIGAQEARKYFNQDRNFERTIGKHLVPARDFDFAKAWKNHIERFLGPSPVRFPDELKGGTT